MQIWQFFHLVHFRNDFQLFDQVIQKFVHRQKTIKYVQNFWCAKKCDFSDDFTENVGRYSKQPFIFIYICLDFRFHLSSCVRMLI